MDMILGIIGYGTSKNFIVFFKKLAKKIFLAAADDFAGPQPIGSGNFGSSWSWGLEKPNDKIMIKQIFILQCSFMFYDIKFQRIHISLHSTVSNRFLIDANLFYFIN